MNLREMIVTDANGKTGEKAENDIAGLMRPVLTADRKEDMFHFYAALKKNPVEMASPAPQDKKPSVVTIVRPLGGMMEGAARFPRVGEKVLVAVNEGGGCYLMGYLPSEEAPFAGEQENLADTLETRQGQVLRYKKTGGNTENEATDKSFSEIGFYSETTEWKEKDGKKNPKTDAATGLPFVDKIKISSTGDIETKAQNYNEVSAKRIALFAGYNDDIDDRKAKQAENLKAGKTDADVSAFPVLPMDNPFEDTSFFQGDIQMRAKERIVLKAGKSLEIVVGRSIVRIDDTGISLISRKVSGSVPNGWDTALTLSSRGGISAFGTRVAINAAYGFSIGEAFGSDISSTAGVLRLNSRDMKLSSICKAAYVVKGTCASLSFGGNIASMSMGTAQNHGGELLGWGVEFPSYFSLGAGLAATGICANWRYACSQAENSDIAGNMRVITDLMLTVLDLVGSVLEKVIPEPDADKGGRDGLTLALAVAEYGIVLQHFIRLNLACLAWMNKAIILLDHRGTLYEASCVKKTFAKRTASAQSPIAGAEMLATELWRGFASQGFKACGTEVLTALALVVGVGGAYYNKTQIDAAVKEELEKL